MLLFALTISLLYVAAFRFPLTGATPARVPDRTALQAKLPLSNFSPVNIAHDLAHIFDDVDLFPAHLRYGIPSGLMLMDIKETNQSYAVHLDLPGVKQGDVQISTHKNELRIHAERKSEHKEHGATYRRVERHVGTVSRSVTLPENADMNSITAEYVRGVLNISIPKLVHEPAHYQKTVEIKYKEQ